VLRVLGNLAGVANFDYNSSEEVREELRLRCAEIAASSYQGSHEPKAAADGAPQSEARVVDVPMYSVDAVLRRAPSLQRTREGKGAAVVYGGAGA
jgi:NADH-quinone oxidoreductase subunit G